MKTTRRRALLFGTTAAAAGLAQSPPPQAAPRSPGDEVESAREAMKRTGEQLATVDLKSDTEPAFVFRAG
ncbi:MAG: hypothetical protein ABI693_05265 [Bryobacteraceae bacterium]